MVELEGGCHCGRIRFRLSAPGPIEELSPRACDCSFCLKHAAAYLSDPHGRLSIDVMGTRTLGCYRQGSHRARFQFCRHCSVLIGAIHVEGRRRYGAVNTRCLDDGIGLATPETVSLQQLDEAGRIARWRALWTPDVELDIHPIPLAE